MLHYFGIILVMTSIFIAAPAIVGVATSNPRELEVGVDFLLVASLSLALGFAFYTLFEPRESLSLREGLYVVAIAWLTIPLVSAIPLSLAINISYLDAVFEAVSGFTTTGLTMVGSYVEQLPRTILLWRSLMQWIGGIGIVIMTLVVLSRPGSPAAVLYVAEGREERIEPSFARTAKTMLRVYTVLTVMVALIFWFSGMPIFDAVNHSMTALATGGFSVKNLSIGSYGSLMIELSCMIGMFLGAQSFVDHAKMLRGRVREVLRGPEVKGFSALLIFFISIAALTLWCNGYSIYESLRLGSFQATSALSGTGFQTANIKASPALFKFILTVAMLIGGSIFSTTGGVKIFRVLVLLKTLKSYMAYAFKPSRSIRVLKIGNTILDEERVIRSLIIISLFLITYILSVWAVLPFVPEGYSLEDVAFETASALGTVGLSVGLTSPSLHPIVKVVFILDMLFGRLEVLTLLSVMYGVFKSRS